MPELEPTKLDRRVDGVASAIIYTTLAYGLVRGIWFGARSGNSGFLCNQTYCLANKIQFHTSPIFFLATAIALIVFYKLGYTYGFSKVFTSFHLKKDKD